MRVQGPQLPIQATKNTSKTIVDEGVESQNVMQQPSDILFCTKLRILNTIGVS